MHQYKVDTANCKWEDEILLNHFESISSVQLKKNKEVHNTTNGQKNWNLPL